MNYFSSAVSEYQPILVGAGCLALGYIYGRHCRSLIEDQVDVPTASEACCALSDSCNYMSAPTAVNPDAMGGTLPAVCPAKSDLNYVEPEVAENKERCAKRHLGQLDMFDASGFHVIARKKEETTRARATYKKQKSVPARRESVRSKQELEDSDNEILARRLEYFTKSVCGTQASINRAEEGQQLRSGKKKKSTVEVITSNGGKRILRDPQKTLSKKVARSLTGLGALATPLRDQGECSLEDTCRSPKTAYPDFAADHHSGENVELGCQLELIESTQQVEKEVPCPKSSTLANIEYTVDGNALKVYPGVDMFLEVGLDPGQVDSHCNFREIGQTSAQDMDGIDVRGTPDSRMEDAQRSENEPQAQEDMGADSPGQTTPVAELHVKDRSPEAREVKQVPQVPVDKVLKAEIYELLHAADCGKVTFEEIVSLLEKKLQVVLRQDKAHIVSLVREVISISKLLEEEKALEASDQV